MIMMMMYDYYLKKACSRVRICPGYGAKLDINQPLWRLKTSGYGARRNSTILLHHQIHFQLGSPLHMHHGSVC